MDLYETFRPGVSDKRGDLPTLAWFCKVDETGVNLTGEFRLAISGNAPMRVPIDLEKILGSNPLPNVKLFATVDVNKLEFRGNGWCTHWFSVNEEIEKKTVSIEPIGLTDRPYEELYDEVRTVMCQAERDTNQVAFRLEGGGAPGLDGLYVVSRFLPGRASTIKSNSLLNASDVNAVTGDVFEVCNLEFVQKFLSLQEQVALYACVLFSSLY